MLTQRAVQNHESSVCHGNVQWEVVDIPSAAICCLFLCKVPADLAGFEIS